MSSTSPALPRKPSAYVTPSSTASSTLPRMRHTRHSSMTSQPIVRVTARTYSTDSSLATQPRMSTSSYQSSRHPVRGDVISGAPMSSNQRFAQAISGSGGDTYSSGYSSPSYGRTSPLISTSTTHYSSTPHSSLSSSYSTGVNPIILKIQYNYRKYDCSVISIEKENTGMCYKHTTLSLLNYITK